MDEPKVPMILNLGDLPTMPVVSVSPTSSLMAVCNRHGEVKVLASAEGRLLIKNALQQQLRPCQIYLTTTDVSAFEVWYPSHTLFAFPPHNHEGFRNERDYSADALRHTCVAAA